jgi:hypothetical protein
MSRFKFYPKGFLKSAEYSTYYHSLTEDTELLNDLKEIQIYLIPDPIIGSIKARTTAYKLADDKESLKIEIFFQQYTNPKNPSKFQPNPTVPDVIQKIKRVLSTVAEKLNSHS